MNTENDTLKLCDAIVSLVEATEQLRQIRLERTLRELRIADEYAARAERRAGEAFAATFTIGGAK